jgi:thioredoxin 1
MIVIVGVVIAAGIVIAVKQHGKMYSPDPALPTSTEPVSDFETAPVHSKTAPKPNALPKLVDLGAGKCIPCKMMAPILDELKETYADKLEVIFIDVWENPDKAKEYGIQMIPTQIFYDATEKELFRHEGFFSKEDILGKWKEFGVILKTETP